MTQFCPAEPEVAPYIFHQKGDATAFYNQVKQTIVKLPYAAIYNPWWWIETHGGLVPPGPPPPWVREFVAGLVLAEAFGRVSPQLRSGVLKLVLEQLSITTAAIKKEIKKLDRQ